MNGLIALRQFYEKDGKKQDKRRKRDPAYIILCKMLTSRAVRLSCTKRKYNICLGFKSKKKVLTVITTDAAADDGRFATEPRLFTS